MPKNAQRSANQPAERSIPRSKRVFDQLAKSSNLIQQGIGAVALDVQDGVSTPQMGNAMFNGLRTLISQVAKGAFIRVDDNGNQTEGSRLASPPPLADDADNIDCEEKARQLEIAALKAKIAALESAC